MSQFAGEMFAGNGRRVRCTATWPRDVPEMGVTAGQEYDLSLASNVWFMAKAARGDSDAQAVISKAKNLASPNAITFGSGPDANVAYFNITPADTAAFITAEEAEELEVEMQVKHAATGEIWTVVWGHLTVKPRVVQVNT